MNLRDAVASGRRYRLPEHVGLNGPYWYGHGISGWDGRYTDAIREDWLIEPPPEPPKCGKHFECPLMPGHGLPHFTYEDAPPPPRTARRWMLCPHNGDWFHGSKPHPCACPMGSEIPVLEILVCECKHENIAHHKNRCFECMCDAFRPRPRSGEKA